MKKVLSAMMVLAMVSLMLTAGVFSVSAAQSGYYTYTVIDSKATINSYDGASTESNVIIPETLGGYPVTNIDFLDEGQAISPAFSGCPSVTSIKIPKYVDTIFQGALSCSNLTTIIVDADNTAFSSEDGVLFNKAKTELIKFPTAKSGEYNIPASVKQISESAIQICPNLTKIFIPEKVNYIGEAPFQFCSSLNEIKVDGNNPNFTSLDGVLFDKAKTTLIKCPATKTGQYVIPGSVTTISNQAFSNCAGLTGVTIPNSVVTINNVAFEMCGGLTTLTIPGSVKTIGDGAFYACDGLNGVYFLGDSPSTGETVFTNETDTFIVYYVSGKTGFPAKWNGYTTKTFEPAATTVAATSAAADSTTANSNTTQNATSEKSDSFLNLKYLIPAAIVVACMIVVALILVMVKKTKNKAK